MLADAMYADLLRYLYVVSTVPVDAITRGALVALIGAFVVAGWRMRGARRFGRPVTPSGDNASRTTTPIPSVGDELSPEVVATALTTLAAAAGTGSGRELCSSSRELRRAERVVL